MILDELAIDERPAQAEVTIVTRLLCYRHDRGLCTVVATNRSPDDLSGHRKPLYGRRVADRLRTATYVGLRGPSWRVA